MYKKSEVPLDDITLHVSAKIQDAFTSLIKTGLGIVFLVDDDHIIKGIATDGDIRQGLLKGVNLETTVCEIMNRAFVFDDVETPIEEILKKMSQAIRVIPLVNKEGKLVDYVSTAQFHRIPVAEPLFIGNELRYVNECVLTSWVSSAGKFVNQFEEMFADFCGVKHGIAVSNGTVALHLALVTLGIGPGDEVIVPTFTFAATANAVIYTGAKPVFVDSHPETWTMDPDAVKDAISPSTRAIIPVHLYGHPADMDPIMALADQHNLWVIEDAAEAHGARYKGQIVGSIGHIGCFSFYGNKIITTGEGGMLTINDDALVEKARVLRDHGMSKERRYWHSFVGFNYRLTNLQAAIGVAQMERVDQILWRKKHLFDLYNHHLNGLSIILPPKAEWAEPVCWLYSILIDNEHVSRDEIIQVLHNQGVETRRVFYPLTDMPLYQKAINASFPVAEKISRNGISLPSSVTLSDREVADVTQKLKNILK